MVSFCIRLGTPNKAIRHALESKSLATKLEDIIDSYLSISYAHWAAGNTETSKTQLAKAQQLAANDNSISTFLLSNIHFSASIILHDLEKSSQLCFHASQAMKLEKINNNLHQRLIASVNLADSLWAIGKTRKAERILKCTLNLATNKGHFHVIDIASICLANVLQEQGRIKEANEYYQSGIDSAERISHQWDAIYGKIYHSFLLLKNDPTSSHLTLENLILETKKTDMRYLSDLARALIISHLANNGRNYNKYKVKKYESVSPLLKCHSDAAEVLTAKKLTRSLSHAFISSLGECEGIKGDRKLIQLAIDKLIKEGELSAVEEEFIIRWQWRFFDKPNSITKCDFRKCEARCCYDGVYLLEEDKDKINLVVAENADYFEFLPKKFLVEEQWNNSNGIKTAVKPHKYKSPDFPSHFNQTRCVFALKDGACSLEALAISKHKEHWTYKPIACVMHPLKTKGKQVLPPSDFLKKDSCYVDITYPGYEKFTPCHQRIGEQTNWKVICEEEINYWTNYIKAKSK